MSFPSSVNPFPSFGSFSLSSSPAPSTPVVSEPSACKPTFSHDVTEQSSVRGLGIPLHSPQPSPQKREHSVQSSQLILGGPVDSEFLKSPCSGYECEPAPPQQRSDTPPRRPLPYFSGSPGLPDNQSSSFGFSPLRLGGDPFCLTSTLNLPQSKQSQESGSSSSSPSFPPRSDCALSSSRRVPRAPLSSLFDAYGTDSLPGTPSLLTRAPRSPEPVLPCTPPATPPKSGVVFSSSSSGGTPPYSSRFFSSGESSPETSPFLTKAPPLSRLSRSVSSCTSPFFSQPSCCALSSLGETPRGPLLSLFDACGTGSLPGTPSLLKRAPRSPEPVLPCTPPATPPKSGVVFPSSSSGGTPPYSSRFFSSGESSPETSPFLTKAPPLPRSVSSCNSPSFSQPSYCALSSLGGAPRGPLSSPFDACGTGSLPGTPSLLTRAPRSPESGLPCTPSSGRLTASSVHQAGGVPLDDTPITKVVKFFSSNNSSDVPYREVSFLHENQERMVEEAEDRLRRYPDGASKVRDVQTKILASLVGAPPGLSPESAAFHTLKGPESWGDLGQPFRNFAKTLCQVSGKSPEKRLVNLDHETQLLEKGGFHLVTEGAQVTIEEIITNPKTGVMLARVARLDGTKEKFSTLFPKGTTVEDLIHYANAPDQVLIRTGNRALLRVNQPEAKGPPLVLERYVEGWLCKSLFPILDLYKVIRTGDGVVEYPLGGPLSEKQLLEKAGLILQKMKDAGWSDFPGCYLDNSKVILDLAEELSKEGRVPPGTKGIYFEFEMHSLPQKLRPPRNDRVKNLRKEPSAFSSSGSRLGKNPGGCSRNLLSDLVCTGSSVGEPPRYAGSSDAFFSRGFAPCAADHEPELRGSVADPSYTRTSPSFGPSDLLNPPNDEDFVFGAPPLSVASTTSLVTDFFSGWDQPEEENVPHSFDSRRNTRKEPPSVKKTKPKKSQKKGTVRDPLSVGELSQPKAGGPQDSLSSSSAGSTSLSFGDGR